MSFWERLANTFLSTLMAYKRQQTYNVVEPIVRAKFALSPLDPTIADLENNVSLVLLNQDPRLFQYPAPNMPNMVGIGGAHCRPARPLLPPDLRAWAEDDQASKNGFVYFSLGSAVSGDNFPENKRRAFAEAFVKINEKFGVKVLWKWDMEIDPVLKGNPRAFRVQKWAPQQDLLGETIDYRCNNKKYK
jgi:glucuronosyltransferase